MKLADAGTNVVNINLWAEAFAPVSSFLRGSG